VSVIVVTYGELPFTRLCLESVLLDPGAPPLELIVVDNASPDGTRDYLARLAARDPRVRVVYNHRNAGFAAAVNQGLAASRGYDLILLNNDPIPPPGSLARLVEHLKDLSVGLVGPVSNRAATAAQVETDHTTMGGLLDAAKRRAITGAGRLVDLPMLTMFCVAMRRGVYEHVGRLDERFQVGLFEDDDYSLRVRWAGFRVVYAEDVFVHHFGEASFGHLVTAGDYARLFEANRRCFEEKWGIAWSPHTRPQPESYVQLVRNVREIVRETVPAGARVLVVSRGDAELLELDDRRAGHFPQLPDGIYAGHYPADSADVLAQLDALEAEFLVFPRTALWWFDHYDGLRDHLEDRLVRADSACSIFALGRSV
jgi:GT2 family glycosyltransferase